MSQEEQIWDYIISDSAEKGVDIQRESIVLLRSTGFMSKVYTAEANEGSVVINIVENPVPEQKYQSVPRKIKFVSDFLHENPYVPTVYAQGKLLNDGYYVVQEYRKGTPLGQRVYENGQFVDKVLVQDADRYFKELQEIILSFHRNTFEDFGYITFDDGKLKGTHKTWADFLADNIERNLDTIYKAQKTEGITYFDTFSYTEAIDRCEQLLEKYKEYFRIEKPRLIHGDIVNYSNVLISDSGISAVIDLEWSLFGHPAWEFVLNSKPPLDIYIPQAQREGIILNHVDFKKSVDLHTVLWSLWAASSHAMNPEFGPALFAVFLKGLTRYM